VGEPLKRRVSRQSEG